MSKTTKDETVTEAADRRDRKTRQGYVVSEKMDKTVVSRSMTRQARLYGKVIVAPESKEHDEATRPVSRGVSSEARPLRARTLELVNPREGK